MSEPGEAADDNGDQGEARRGDDETLGYLVLTRRVGQGIMIDGKVEVYVKEWADRRVSLAIRAPKNVRIMRMEKVGPKRGY